MTALFLTALADEANPTSAAQLTLRRALYPAGYGAMSPNGTRATLQGLTLDEVKAQYKAVVQPKGATVVVVETLGLPIVEHDAQGNPLPATPPEKAAPGTEPAEQAQ